MKIVDERKKKDVEEEWHVGDFIEIKNTDDNSFLGMIIQDDYGCCWLLNLKTGNTLDTNVTWANDVDDLISSIKNNYTIARKVNVELHIEEAEDE